MGSDSKYCWKCGAEQSAEMRKAFYGDRWHRSAVDFAIRVQLNTPERCLHHGLQVEEGTLALLFQNGEFKGVLEAGYHTFDNFLQRLAGLDKGKEAHAVLLDAGAADVDFAVEGVRVAEQVPVDVRLRLLFKVADAREFARRFLGEASPTFTTRDLTARFEADVREALQEMLAARAADELMCELRVRQMVEGELVARLAPVLAREGLTIEGVRLADFGGAAVETIRAKLGEMASLNREAEVNRRLEDALREEKIAAFRDEQELQDYYERVTAEYGMKSFDREAEKKRFVAAADHRDRLEGLRTDYEARRAEISNRLDEQKLKQEGEILAVRHEVEQSAVRFEEDLRQQRARFEAGQEQQVVQSRTDLEVARQGLQALREVKEAKIEARRKEEEMDMHLEGERLRMRGDASLQALLATTAGEQADRLLKLAELEMRKGLDAEQALALVAEKSPEIAGAVAEALKAKYSASRGDA